MGNCTFRFVSLSLYLFLAVHCNKLKWRNALSHKLEVGKWRSLASQLYTLTTDVKAIPTIWSVAITVHLSHIT